MAVKTIEYRVSDAKVHTIYIKYIKDQSFNRGNDSLQFRVRFE